MEHFDDYCKLVENELIKIAKKPELDANSLRDLGNLLDAKKDLLDIVLKERQLQGGFSDNGQSMRMMPRDPYYGYEGASYYSGNGMSMGSGMNNGQSGAYPDAYGYRYPTNPQNREDSIRQTMDKIYR